MVLVYKELLVWGLLLVFPPLAARSYSAAVTVLPHQGPVPSGLFAEQVRRFLNFSKAGWSMGEVRGM